MKNDYGCIILDGEIIDVHMVPAQHFPVVPKQSELLFHPQPLPRPGFFHAMSRGKMITLYSLIFVVISSGVIAIINKMMAAAH